MMTDIISKPFNQLTTFELYQLLQARNQIFVVEQHCAYQDLDGLDIEAQHVQLFDPTKQLLGYCRILAPKIINLPNAELISNLITSPMPQIGRVLVLPKYRGHGLARALMTYAIRFCQQAYPNLPIYIAAQAYLSDFYQSLGFQSIGKPFDEDGILHISMIKHVVAT